jgi:NADPH:quinone reductase-like Zn-dependent oxidoreductase
MSRPKTVGVNLVGVPPEMRAVQIDRYGGPEVLEIREVAPPPMRDGEVLVRSIATSINPIDRKLRTTDRNLGLPLTLGWDLAGIVVDSAVSEFHTGDRVIATSNVVSTGNGTWADLVALPAADLAMAPSNATLVEAATLPLAGLTALQAWRKVAPVPGARVLVIGAAGSIGAHLVQYGVDSDVVVDGVVSRSDHLDEAEEFGATIATTDHGQLPDGTYDVLFDTVGLPQSGVDARRLLKPSGQYVALPSAGALPDNLDTRRVLVERDPEGLRELVRLVESGTLRLRVAASYPLREIRAAHTHFEAGGLLGKVVVIF